MSRALQLTSRILRALLYLASAATVAVSQIEEDEATRALLTGVVLALIATGLSPALWPKLPAAPERPAPAPALPPQAPAAQQNTYGQPVQAQQPYPQAPQSTPPYPASAPPQSGVYGAPQPQVPQQQQPWPGQAPHQPQQ